MPLWQSAQSSSLFASKKKNAIEISSFVDDSLTLTVQQVYDARECSDVSGSLFVVIFSTDWCSTFEQYLHHAFLTFRTGNVKRRLWRAVNKGRLNIALWLTVLDSNMIYLYLARLICGTNSSTLFNQKWHNVFVAFHHRSINMTLALSSMTCTVIAGGTCAGLCCRGHPQH